MFKFVAMKGFITGIAALGALVACTQHNYVMGTYAYDLKLLKDKGIETVELTSEDGRSRVLAVPAWQGRVMTSTARGEGGESFGWINHKFIKEGVRSPQFNNWGGEERFWLGPEGGANSWYFAPGARQSFSNWKVPAPFDTDTFEVSGLSQSSVRFSRDVRLGNARGREFSIGMSRLLNILDRTDIEEITGQLPKDVDFVGYRSDNSITNLGSEEWSEQSGMPSVWMLGMINPSQSTTVFIPYNTEGTGTIVKDDYFGQMPPGRLSVHDGVVFFKIDGKYRSKIGLNASRTLGLVGAFDPEQGLLTILKTGIPAADSRFVNSQWGEQEDAFGGDALNSYNDGPTEDGTVMGPFYEIETSSPAAALAPGQTLTHSQTTIHIQGPAKALEDIIEKVFAIDPALLRSHAF